MTTINVTVDSRHAEEMLGRIASNTSRLPGVVAAVADQGAGMVTGISDSTLAASVHATPGRQQRAPTSFLIVSDEDRARFVFAARPPSFPADTVAHLLAENIAQELLR